MIHKGTSLVFFKLNESINYTLKVHYEEFNSEPRNYFRINY